MGVPIRGATRGGLDALLSAVRVADGLPVACMALHRPTTPPSSRPRSSEGLGGRLQEL